jgi:twitching motility protein PilT
MVQVEIGGRSVELTMAVLLNLAVQHKASDLHLKHQMAPTLRIEGQLRPLNVGPLTTQEIEALIQPLLSDRLQREYQEIGSCDFSHALEGGDRFRINVFRQRGFTSVSCRRVQRRIPTFAELHLIEAPLVRLAGLHQGLIIFAGQTGSGKSTSIARMLEHINQQRACHIVTIEDPIEYLYEDKKAFISQREVGTDVESMTLALKYLMREDPDVVLIGEMRDRDTFEAAIQAAETGHLVFATLHASSAGSAIGRILDLYPEQQQKSVRQSLAFSLAGIIVQMLLPSELPDSKRVPAMEIMIATGMIRRLIRDAEDEKIAEVIAGGMHEGMITFTASFTDLVSKGWINHQTAYEYAPNQDELRMALKGIAVRQGIIR